jgi:hypothetical protein
MNRSLRHARLLAGIALMASGLAAVGGTASAGAPTIPSYQRGQLTPTASPPCGDLGYRTCVNFTISGCPNQLTGNNAPAGTIADDFSNPDVTLPAIGLVVFFSGEEGLNYWGAGLTNFDTQGLLHYLRQQGYQTVQVKWSTVTPPPSSVTSWLQAKSPYAQSRGADDMGCKPATVLQWIWDNRYNNHSWPPHDLGKCGFCLTGNSGGASQAGYALALYTYINGFAVDAFLPSSGPVHTEIDGACTDTSPYEFLTDGARGWIDASYGWQLGSTQKADCWNETGTQQNGWLTTWDHDGLDYLISAGGGGFGFPDIRVEVITGATDEINTRRHPCLFYTTLKDLGMTTTPVYSKIDGMGHRVQDSLNGGDALIRAIQDLPGNPEYVCPPA